jgi:uracil-DNA glycosylase family 4
MMVTTPTKKKLWYDTYVPDSGPENASILFVGEAPGETETIQLQPFVGESGNILLACLNRAGVERGDVRLANLCHYRPSGFARTC